LSNDLDIASIPRSRIASLIIQLAARLAEPEEPTATAMPTDDGDDRWLTVEELAERLRCSVKSIYRRVKTFPFARRSGRSWIFSEQGLTKWLAHQRV
jgi:excisionase family DNA binding protein